MRKDRVKVFRKEKSAPKLKPLKVKHNCRQRLMLEFVTDAVAEIIIKEELLDTYQPVAAIAIRCSMPTKTALTILRRMHEKGTVAMSKCRPDGHNEVHFFKNQKYINVMGIKMPCSEEVEEV